MFDIDKKGFYIFLVLFMVIMFAPVDCFATFESLTSSGKKIFWGLRSIIYPASAIGIICVCIGGFFGNINWKWLTTVVIGLIVITLCSGFIGLFVDSGSMELNDGAILSGD